MVVQMNKNKNIIRAYAKMLADGSAFEHNRYKNPTLSERENILKHIYGNLPGYLKLSYRKKELEEKTTSELKEILSDMLIKEEEFMV